MTRGRQNAIFWAGAAAEVGVVATSLIYLFDNELSALVTWELLASAYLTVGLIIVWGGKHRPAALHAEVRKTRRWPWMLPLISSFAGVNSAILALISSKSGTDYNVILGAVASIGVLLSWTLLHTGLAQMYRTIDATSDWKAIYFPGDDSPAFMNYLYFAFTIGTSFAASDVVIKTVRARRLVLVHSVISFFYNALVVAVAFQVLQYVAST